jgi:integrase
LTAGTIIPRGNKSGAKITINGKQLWIGTFDDRDLASAALARTNRSPHPTLTVADLVDQWTNRPDVEHETNRQNGYKIKRFVERYGSRPAASFLRIEAVRWLSIHFTSARYAKAMFEYAVELEVCEDNPFAGLKVAKKSAPKIPPTPADVQRAAQAALEVHDGHEALLAHDLLLVSSQTGLRLHELAGLTPQNLISGPSPRLSIIGKGKKLRTVPVPQSIVGILQRRSTNRVLFARAGKVMSRQDVHRLMKPVREAAGLEGMNFHLLRHHYATELANRGVQDRDAAFAMWGHGNTRLLKEVYAHPDREAATRRIEEVLNGS